MNVFESNLVNSDRVRFAIDGGPIFDFADSDIPESIRAAIGRRDKVVIGVRPHAVRLGAGSADARIVSNQWLGDQSHLAMEVAGKLMVAVSHAPIPAKVGERLRFGVSASDLDCVRRRHIGGFVTRAGGAMRRITRAANAKFGQ